MPKAYDPSKAEGPLYAHWLNRGYFKPRIVPDREPFCVIMPPPNVTGELHLGHALTATVEDCLVRWHRMLGDPTLWVPGVDHAGIATQNVVEKDIAKEGLSRHDLGRDEFLNRVWKWVGKYRSLIGHQHMRLGVSCDWEREVFTMDEGPQRAVRTTFVRLYNDGLIYRGERIINWCPRCMTALSDLEVEHEEHDGFLWYVRYPVLDEGGHPTDDYIVMGTTRPETIVGDVAVAVNPNVERWKKYIGRTVLLPVIERPIPVIADDAVDPEFGTGAVKVTPGHDPNDFEIGERHGLPAIVAMNLDATMNAEAGPYEGLDRFEARERIVADIEALGLLEKKEPHRHSIGHCERCDTIVEPLISKQWFVKMAPLAQPAIECVRDGRIEIIPERFERIYMHWMENIRDWTISRQLWWGHRIPVWYCENGHQFASVDQPASCADCGSAAIEQDADVLDTWFSSALWPHSTLGWPEEAADLKYWYPTSVLETGYDIIFFWVARMIMMGLYNMGDVPFRHVYLHGLIRDAQGRKMTKSRGNVVDPLVLIDKYGTDALRFTLATSGTPGNDFRLFDDKLESSRNFANKIWNAARFVIQSIAEEKVRLPEDRRAVASRQDWPLEDRWIVSRALATAQAVNKLLAEFQINEAGRLLYEFFWSDYCDWYLEMAKVRLRENDRSPLPVLAYVLQSSLRLLHPMMPFVTEAVWQHLRGAVEGLEPEAIIVAPYPSGKGELDPEAEDHMRLVKDVVTSIREVKAVEKIPPSESVHVRIAAIAGDQRQLEAEAESARQAARGATTKRESDDLALAARIFGHMANRPEVVGTILDQQKGIIGRLSRSTVRVVDSIDPVGEEDFRYPRGEFELAVRLPIRTDPNSEIGLIRKQLAQVENEIERLESNVGNEQFRSKAPHDVIERAELRLAEAKARAEDLKERLRSNGRPQS
jgi:valyl-tRNA synthetase